MNHTSESTSAQSADFPQPCKALEQFGLKFSSGGAHISRTIMLEEISAVWDSIPVHSTQDEYRSAILQQNILGKTTSSTRLKSLRHLRELYGLDEKLPIYAILRKLRDMDKDSTPLLAMQVAWARDPLLRATTRPVLEATVGARVETSELAAAINAAFPDQYSALNCNKVARNAASSWTQSGHLMGRANKVRRHVQPTIIATTLALFLGNTAGYHGEAVFSNPWCRLLDLDHNRARALGIEANRAGFLNLRMVGEVIELSFPQFAEYQVGQS